MTTITVQNFTGKAFPLNVDPESTVADLKAAIMAAKSPGSNQIWQIEPNVTFNGHELRDHQKISHYGISKGNVLHIGGCQKKPG